MKTSIKFFLAFLILFSQTTFANDILQEFLDKFSKLEYIEYKVAIINEKGTPEEHHAEAKCIYKIVPEEKTAGFYFNITTEEQLILFNGTEYFSLYPVLYGENIVNYLNIKKNPEKFKEDTLMMDGQMLIGPAQHTNSIFHSYSILELAKDIKSDMIAYPMTVTDTIINGIQAINYKVILQDTVKNDVRNYYFVNFAFDKSNSFPIFYSKEYVSSDFSNSSEVNYSDFNFDKKDDKKYFSRSAVDKKYKIVENAPYVERKELLKVGEKAPGWELTSLDEKKYQMKESNDKIRLLAITKINCAPCMLSVPKLNELCKEFPGIDILAIYPLDDRKTLESYKKSKKIVYPILPTDKNVSDLYNVSGYPAFFLVDKNGVIQFVQSGYGEGSKEKFKEAIEKLLK
jgi:thiol-disulfide isomerase/thioredoxin